MEETKLSPNVLSLIGLSNEYCMLLENVQDTDKTEFISEVLRLLPRIYITINDVSVSESDCPEDEYLMMGDYLDEDYYESVRRRTEALIGEDDMFLETFEEDMKYSDTPIAVSISEYLTYISRVV